jgi:hypothetical protein
VRVVVAEPVSAGSLQYLLEAEGFQVVGCASDERELERVLDQDLHPDVIVLDADVVATSVLVVRHHEPDAHVVVIWPDGVQPPRGADRVPPAAVYEELGPTIRRHAETHAVADPIIVLPDDAPPTVALEGAGAGFGRTASRVSLTTVTLIAAIVFTMGVSFALGGYSGGSTMEPPRVDTPRPAVATRHVGSDADAGRDSMPSAAARGRHRCDRSGASCADTSHDRPQPSARKHPAPPVNDNAAEPTGGGGATTPPIDHTGGGHGGNSGGDQGDDHEGDAGGGNQDDQGQQQDDQGEDDRGSDDHGSDDQGADGQGAHGSQGDAGQGDDRR